jgi:hypothetical protein
MARIGTDGALTRGSRTQKILFIRVHPVRQAKTGFSIDLKSNQHVK